MTEKRLKCPICDYLMRVLDETDEGYLCYCVKCNKERYVDKYSFKQFLIDIERGKEIEENLLIDLFQRQESKIEKLNNENEQLKTQLDYIQNLISEHIKHQKTELGQKALKEVIQDYNKWLLEPQWR